MMMTMMMMMVCCTYCMKAGRSSEHYTGKPFDKILIGMQSVDDDDDDDDDDSDDDDDDDVT